MRNVNRWGRPAGNERGIALPLALLGLISVSLLVTTALITSTTELAISNAHQSSTKSIYVAEGGVQAYVAQYGQILAPGVLPSPWVPPGGTANDAVRIEVVELGTRQLAAGNYVKNFAVRGRATAQGAREVMAIVQQRTSPAVTLDTDVRSALTLGGNLDVNGNAFTINGRTSDPCATGGGVQAVERAKDSQISVNSELHWMNFKGIKNGVETEGKAAIDDSGLTSMELARRALGLKEGQSLEDLIAAIPAEKKWGPRYSPPGGPVREFDGYVNDGELVAVVDANGGYVDLLGGSGIIIIVNGDLRMTGDAKFKGIIIVEGNFVLTGNPTVTGALISFGNGEENQIVLDETAILSGHVTVQYNMCEIQAAEEAFAAASVAGSAVMSPILGWTEVLR